MSCWLSTVLFSIAVIAFAMLLRFPASTPLTISSVLLNAIAHRGLVSLGQVVAYVLYDRVRCCSRSEDLFYSDFLHLGNVFFWNYSSGEDHYVRKAFLLEE